MDEPMGKCDVACEWLFYAKNDLESAEYLLGKRPVPVEIICFHCQQAAEKMLKGLLVLHEIRPSKTHDLLVLYDLCQPSTSDIDKILTQCKRLNPYSVEPRYPNELMISEQQIQTAIVDAREIFEFCLPFYSQNDNPKF
jgi:HEPN domain-containing protein